MPLHDAYARLTPYEVSLPDLDRARDRFRAVAEEARERGVDPTDPARFMRIGAVGEMLEDLRSPDEDPERTDGHVLLLFHAFHFWDAGEPLFLLEAPVVRRLVAAPPSPAWRGEPPSPAGYVQLPQHLVWTPGEGEPPARVPESVDGFFWSALSPRRELRILLASGVRQEKSGFSVVALPPAPAAAATEWLDVAVREEGGDFESTMPGAELEGLYELRTSGEALKLVARTLGWLAAHPGRQGPAGTEGHPVPTRLPYRKVEL